ncbi:MAG: aspartate--tRNA(Asn) ligase [Candidatus Daviesbacteria bacterium]|nr:aspartate--tRNA(Asn) ligase [Candidatus Daviesbacteria bacterium]
MERTLILDCNEKIGEKVKICGWVQTRRDHGKIIFLDILDRSGVIQVVVSPEQVHLGGVPSASLGTTVRGDFNLRHQDVVCIEGSVAKRPEKLINSNLETGTIELQAKNIEVLSKAEDLPFDPFGDSEPNLDLRLDWRFLDLRRPQSALIFKVWTIMEQAFTEYCISNDFIEIHSPKTVVTSTESGSELFEITYFDKKAYLAQSPQLYKQMAMASGLEKVFEIGPVFRANPSFTSRHDTEFTMYDIEMSFINSHFDLMTEEEKMVKAMVEAVKNKYGEQVKKYFDREIIIPTLPFPKLTFKEAKEILAKLGIKSEKAEDFSPEEEREISKYILKEHGHEFVFIHDWPASARAFYSMRLESDPKLSKTFDLLWNGLEITSGAQREHRYDILVKQIEEKGFGIKPFESYLSFFRYGMPPHGGFAPGPSRMVMKMLNLNNVREVTYLYRGPNRLTP